MARILKHEACMFCSEAPCACARPKSARKERRAPASAPAAEEAPSPPAERKPGPFAAAGFVHAAEALGRPVLEDRRATEEERTVEARAHAVALLNVITVFGESNIHPESMHIARREMALGGIHLADGSASKEWRSASGLGKKV